MCQFIYSSKIINLKLDFLKPNRLEGTNREFQRIKFQLFSIPIVPSFPDPSSKENFPRLLRQRNPEAQDILLSHVPIECSITENDQRTVDLQDSFCDQPLITPQYAWFHCKDVLPEPLFDLDEPLLLLDLAQSFPTPAEWPPLANALENFDRQTDVTSVVCRQRRLLNAVLKICELRMIFPLVWTVWYRTFPTTHGSQPIHVSWMIDPNWLTQNLYVIPLLNHFCMDKR